METIKKGDRVQFRDAFDEWHNGFAASDVEGTHADGRKIHDFPVIFVRKPYRTGPVIPWPVKDVRRAE